MTEPLNPPLESGETLWHYAGGEWRSIPYPFSPEQESRIAEIVADKIRQVVDAIPDPAPLRARTPASGAPVEIVISTRVQIDSKTIFELIWPDIQQRLDDDLAAGLAVIDPPRRPPPDGVSAAAEPIKGEN